MRVSGQQLDESQHQRQGATAFVLMQQQGVGNTSCRSHAPKSPLDILIADDPVQIHDFLSDTKRARSASA